MTDGVDGAEGADPEADDHAEDAGEAADLDSSDADETTPHVELQLYQLSVGVTGQSDDDLDDVSATAKELMDYLVDTAESLEDDPDDRGLG